MEVYILQENYSYTDYDAGWDENGSYEEDVERHDVIGVFATLDDAVRKLVETCRLKKECDLSGDEYWNYDILVGNTEKTSVRWIPRREYNDLIATFNDKQKEL